MTDKKTPVKRPVALPRLYKSIDGFMQAHDLNEQETIGMLLNAIQAEWFKEAQK